MHKTTDLNDGYMGSGKLIRFAIQKYGIDKFQKEYLYIGFDELKMKQKEKELVVISENTYNLCDGGLGGWSYVNRNNIGDKSKAGKLGRIKSEQSLIKRHGPYWRLKLGIMEKMRKGLKEKYPNGTKGFKGKKHSEKTKEQIGKKLSILQKGNKNSQFGTCWITNGMMNKKIKKDDLHEWKIQGYKLGRI